LEANSIRKITEDKNGTKWLATNMGLYFYQEGKFIAVDEIKDNRKLFFVTVFVDSDNTVWAGTASHGLYKVKKNAKGECKITEYNSENGLGSNYVYDVCEDAGGKLWISSFGAGITILDKKSDKFELHSLSSPINEVIHISKLNKNEMVFGTRTAGAFRCSISDPSANKLIAGTENSMECLFMERKHRLHFHQ
jgi:ligand-binding sensor domain-containing protein